MAYPWINKQYLNFAEHYLSIPETTYLQKKNLNSLPIILLLKNDVEHYEKRTAARFGKGY